MKRLFARPPRRRHGVLERTAVDEADEFGWFVAAFDVTAGVPKRRGVRAEPSDCFEGGDDHVAVSRQSTTLPSRHLQLGRRRLVEPLELDAATAPVDARNPRLDQDVARAYRHDLVPIATPPRPHLLKHHTNKLIVRTLRSVGPRRRRARLYARLHARLGRLRFGRVCRGPAWHSCTTVLGHTDLGECAPRCGDSRASTTHAKNGRSKQPFGAAMVRDLRLVLEKLPRPDVPREAAVPFRRLLFLLDQRL
mmetsp:Transcript_19274/g.60623  ORF Transcript_19274/g.60623 Transcript_19274/m.60623 type:complete len:250 (-) Transcript_19274:20-769(-)